MVEGFVVNVSEELVVEPCDDERVTPSNKSSTSSAGSWMTIGVITVVLALVLIEDSSVVETDDDADGERGTPSNKSRTSSAGS